MLLVFEMTLFMSLIVPMPFTWKRKLFTFLSENPIVAQMQYWMKVYAPRTNTICEDSWLTFT
jgi:B-cell receptor-associated protein 31